MADPQTGNHGPANLNSPCWTTVNVFTMTPNICHVLWALWGLVADRKATLPQVKSLQNGGWAGEQGPQLFLFKPCDLWLEAVTSAHWSTLDEFHHTTPTLPQGACPTDEDSYLLKLDGDDHVGPAAAGIHVGRSCHPGF